MQGMQDESTPAQGDHTGAPVRDARAVADALRDPRTRRDFLRALGVGGSIVLLPSLFAACGDDDLGPFGPPTAASGGAGVRLDLSTDIGILNYAFALEQLEAAFYTAVTTASNFQTLFPDANEREVLTDVAADAAWR